MSFKRFNVDAELQNLRDTPAKVAKPANPTPNFSNFSEFSGGTPTNLKNSACPHCGKEATIETIDPSLDGERTLTYWRCDACPAAGVKPEPMQDPPQTVKPAPSPLKDRYRQAADAVLNDCLTIDPIWLADRQPQLWQRMTLIDRQLERLEQRNAEPAEYEAMLQQLVQTVKKARALFEQENQQGAAVQ